VDLIIGAIAVVEYQVFLTPELLSYLI